MKGHMFRLGQQTLVYGLSGASLQLFGLITLPIVARVFSTAEYGILELVTSTVAVLAIFVDLGLASASQRSYFDYSDEQEQQRRTVLSTTAATCITASIVLMVAMVIARVPIAEFLFDKPERDNLITIAAIALPMLWLMNFTREVMRLHFRTWQYLRSSLLAGLLGSAFIVFALLVLNMKADGVLLSTVIGAGAAAIYGLVVIRHDVGRTFSRPELFTMLSSTASRSCRQRCPCGRSPHRASMLAGCRTSARWAKPGWQPGWR